LTAVQSHITPESKSRSLHIQPKLEVGAVNSPEEKEADDVAEKVMRMPSGKSLSMSGFGGSGSTMSGLGIQRTCSSCGEEKINRKAANAVSSAPVKSEPLKEEKVGTSTQIQAKGNNNFAGGGFAGGNLTASINASRGTGSPLNSSVSESMGSKMGADFSSVNIHTGEQSASFNNQLNSRAFTVGNDIYFNSNEYQPATPSGQQLIAHELTHTIQQKSVPKVQRYPGEGLIDGIGNAADAVYDNTIGAALEWGADTAWSIVESVASSGFVSLLREISSKGIFTFLADKIKEGLSGLFDSFPAVGSFVTNLISVFGMLYERVSSIMDALMSGDCAPLIAAANEIKTIISTVATDAWNDLVEFVRPIGEFFGDLWASYGAPVVDWLSETAGDVWAWMQQVGQDIWDWTEPVRDYGAMAWDWVKETLGFGQNAAGEENSNGVLQWITDVAGDAWDGIKSFLNPVIEPISDVITWVADFLPLDFLSDLSDTATNMAQGVNDMSSAMGDDGAQVAAQQASLRDTILPAMLERVVQVQQGISATGRWISHNVGGFVNKITGFYAMVAGSEWFGPVAGAIGWLNDTATSLGGWIQDSVIVLFDNISSGVGYLASFIRPILNGLQRVVTFLSDMVGAAADFILGPFMLIPECIRTPIKDFLIVQILGRIPLFQQLSALPDLWERAQSVAMTILYQVFVDGDLFGAMWTFFRTLLELVGIPPELIVSILANVSSAVVDILANPVGFFINMLTGLKDGFGLFFENIGTHLLNGVVNWLTGTMQSMGIQPPADFSFSSIFGFILQILGITIDNIFRLLATRIGDERAAQLRGMLDMATGAWTFVQDVVERGPVAIWERIQDQLSNLWESVIGGIVTYITERIMVQATLWLTGMLDISGIMPVVNSLIAVYRAIQSFVQYFVPILQIINQYTGMLADVARGNVAGAAAFLERILAGSIPIMIGFLASQFGFGNLGERIGEILSSIQERINNGILWVIDQAIAVGGAIMQAGRDAVGAIQSWFTRQVDFTDINGDPHEMYFEGSSSSRHLMVASGNPQQLTIFLDRIIASTTESQTRKDDATECLRIYNSDVRPKQTQLIAIQVDGTTGRAIDTTKQADLERLSTEFWQSATTMTTILRRLLGRARLSNVLERYALEGIAGTYGSVPKPVGDRLTGDHQPQASALIYAANQTFFPATNPIKDVLQGSHAPSAYVINLHHFRHVAGRTYGGKSQNTLHPFRSAVDTIAANTTKTDQEKRDDTVDLLKVELREDVREMRAVLTVDNNWRDLSSEAGMAPLPDPDTVSFRRELTTRINRGEDVMLRQNLDRYK